MKGTWSVACDSYGKVRHSKKACIYTGEGSVESPLRTVAARIQNWKEAYVMAAAPEMLAALKELSSHPAFSGDAPEFNEGGIAYEAIQKAEGQT